MTAEAEFGVMQLQARECQERPGATGIQEEARKAPSLGPLEGVRLSQHLDLGLPAFKTSRE